ncbi:MAG: protein kinase, partial [Kofleriaceae bacterium]
MEAVSSCLARRFIVALRLRLDGEAAARTVWRSSCAAQPARCSILRHSRSISNIAHTTGAAMIGSRIGQYRVLALLGEGGMGKVLLVEHAVIGTRHALKMLHDEMSNNQMIVQRFLNEARAAGAIGHRNVVEISHVDQVEGGGPWYLVMKYLEGQTLSAFLSRRAATVDQRLIVHVIGEALNGLQAAHDRRIIHRDLKPDNLFLTAVKGDPYRTV